MSKSFSTTRQNVIFRLTLLSKFLYSLICFLLLYCYDNSVISLIGNIIALPRVELIAMYHLLYWA